MGGAALYYRTLLLKYAYCASGALSYGSYGPPSLEPP